MGWGILPLQCRYWTCRTSTPRNSAICSFVISHCVHSASHALDGRITVLMGMCLARTKLLKGSLASSEASPGTAAADLGNAPSGQVGGSRLEPTLRVLRLARAFVAQANRLRGVLDGDEAVPRSPRNVQSANDLLGVNQQDRWVECRRGGGLIGVLAAMPTVYEFCGASCCSKSLVLSLVAASLAWASSA